MEMTSPAPRKSQFHSAYLSEQNVDYAMNSPLNNGFPYPCRGYPQGASAGTYSAGSAIHVTIAGEAAHNGGHCQFALSYDNGENFVVVKDVRNNCLIGSGLEFDIVIPPGAPSSDNVVFAWSWINKTGNREYYMNCADIKVQGSNRGRLTGPKLLVANIPGYPLIDEFTVEGSDDGWQWFENRPNLEVGPGGKTREIQKFKQSGQGRQG